MYLLQSATLLFTSICHFYHLLMQQFVVMKHVHLKLGFCCAQVYATSNWQDHWLLGLQYVFKAYKDPIITQVDFSDENVVTVNISTQVCT
jgi:hypothetical protein